MAVMLACAGLSQPASAQGRNQLGPPPTTLRRTIEPPPVASGVPWPRLDVGTVLCRSQDDLRRRSEAMAARASGSDGPPGPPPDCRIVSVPTPIEVLSRPVPSATEVRIKVTQRPGMPAAPAGETGWTDTWLPEKAPR